MAAYGFTFNELAHGGVLTPIRQWLKANLSVDVLWDASVDAAGILRKIPTDVGGALVYDFLNPQSAGLPNEGETVYEEYL